MQTTSHEPFPQMKLLREFFRLSLCPLSYSVEDRSEIYTADNQSFVTYNKRNIEPFIDFFMTTTTPPHELVILVKADQPHLTNIHV